MFGLYIIPIYSTFDLDRVLYMSFLLIDAYYAFYFLFYLLKLITNCIILTGVNLKNISRNKHRYLATGIWKFSYYMIASTRILKTTDEINYSRF
jgi:hypothetical protein